jgi:condensin complex subunit 2
VPYFADVQQISDAGNEASLNDNKVKKRKREPFSIDFLNRPDTENGAAFAPPKNQRLLLLPQSSSSGKTTLPEDCHYQPEGLVKLFLLPSVMVSTFTLEYKYPLLNSSLICYTHD